MTSSAWAGKRRTVSKVFEDLQPWGAEEMEPGEAKLGFPPLEDLMLHPWPTESTEKGKSCSGEISGLH